MKRWFYFIFIFLLIFTLIAGTAYFLYKRSEVPVLLYTTELPRLATIVNQTIANGKILPRREIMIKSQVGGVIEKLFFKSGDYVEAGQIVAQIKIIPNVVQLNEADVNLKKAKLSFKNAEQ